MLVSVCVSLAAAAQPVDPSLTSGLRWRMIGPYRGGRSIAVSGIQGQPNVYYFGSVGGGVWKTMNGGETWEPVFDGQPIASVGALAVAPSNPNVIYVGTGEADFRSDLSYGNGMYKSTDAGKTWTHIGLRDSRHIARVIVDPRNADVVLVAALGEAYGPSPERGVFRSTDGGDTWQKALYKDENIGAIDLAADPDDPQTVYAALLHDQRPPWSTYPPFTTSGAIYKSVDNGVTWQQITGGGLPTGDWGRIGLGVARGTHGQRIYALLDTRDGGLFRSDDAGKTWTLVSTDARIRGRLWYFCEVTVDPRDPDTVYLPNVSIYRSSDGGKSFVGIKGAPGGDDYHSLWIDPADPQRMIFGSDQGVGISVDGGTSWSSWYNQPTAQIYHVAVDNQFPYHVYGAQQDSGTIDTSSRGNDGSITFRDWHPAGAGESGYIVPDPADPTILYGGGTYGELVRYDKRTGQSQIIAPEAVRSFGADPTKAPYRFTWTSPIVFSPQDPHVLYFGSQYLLKTTDRGNTWQKISPDLTGVDASSSHDGPTTVENAKQLGHGVIYTIAPSPVKAGQIWVGTDTGLIHLTRDGGKTWTDVTPAALTAWSKISVIEASRFDAATAYAAVDRHRLSDIAPYIYRTRDAGKTWTRINAGVPDGAYVRTVREDGIRQGLLFAGTELGVYFSIDDGDHWQPLQLNLPIAPVHDIAVKHNDLVIATHGRSFWILDDITPLRQINAQNASSPVVLFQPATAMRIRPSTNHDTPLPGEVPAGENPPPGAVFYYYLQSPAQGEVKIEILDSHGQVARAYSSAGNPWSPPTNLPIPPYWFHPPLQPSTAAGLHRFVWDLRYSIPPVPAAGYGMSTAIALGVPLEPEGPLALPGQYQVQLTVNGKSYRQSFSLTMDPRVATAAPDLERQFALAARLTQGLERALLASRDVHDARAAGRISEETERKLAGGSGGRGGGGAAPDAQASGGGQLVPLSQLAGTLGQLIGVVESADAAPTTQAVRAAEETLTQLQATLAEWEKTKR